MLLENLRQKLEIYLHGHITLSLLASVTDIPKAEVSWDDLKTLHDELINELSKLRAILSEVDSEDLKKIIESEIEKIESTLELYRSHEKIISPPVPEIKNAWHLIGYSIFRGDKYEGYVQGVYLTIPKLEIVLRVIKEDLLTNNELKIIHSKLYENLLTSLSFEEFREELINDIIQAFRVNKIEAFRPSLVKSYLKATYRMIPDEVNQILSTNIENIGYINLNEITHVEWKENKIDIGEKQVKKDVGKIFHSPDIIEEVNLNLDKPAFLTPNNIHSIYHQTWLPLTGHSAILLIRDTEGLPVPSEDFVKKILIYLETKSFKKSESAPKITKKGDLYWRLRVLIMRSLSDIPSLTEKRALQPKFVFEFALRKRIPLTYSELYQSYFDVIPVSYLTDLGDKYVPKVPVKPLPLSAVISSKTIGIILTEKECPNFLGAGIKKNEGLIIECCDPITNEVLEKISKEFKLDKNVLRDIAHEDVKKLIRFLIVSGKINDRKDYDKLTTILNKKEIRYDELVDKLSDKGSQMMRITLAYRIKNI